jgi:hypothetical protein
MGRYSSILFGLNEMLLKMGSDFGLKGYVEKLRVEG